MLKAFGSPTRRGPTIATTTKNSTIAQAEQQPAGAQEPAQAPEAPLTARGDGELGLVLERRPGDVGDAHRVSLVRGSTKP